MIQKLKQLKTYLLPFKGEIIGALIALFFGSASVLSLGIGIRFFVDQGISAANDQWLTQALLFMLIGITILSLSTFFRYYFVYNLSEKLIARLKIDLYAHLVSLKLDFLNKQKSGELLSRLANDTTILQMILATTIPIALRNILLFCGGIILIFFTSVKLTLLLLILIPIIIFPILYSSRKIKNLTQENQTLLATLHARANEVFSSMPIVKAFQKEKNEIDRFKKQTNTLLKSVNKRIKARAFMAALVIFLTTISIGFVLWIGGQDVLRGELSPGDLSAFIFYAFLTASAFGSLSEASGELSRAAGAIARIFDLFHAGEKENYTPPQTIKPKKNTPILEMKNLYFSYPNSNEPWKLEAISLTIEQNEMIAIVGPSGAGKSTFFQLLLAFYEADKGTIKLWGEDYKNHTPQTLRSHFSYVAQDPYLFSGTIEENIAYGALQPPSYKMLEDVSIKARAHSFIKKLAKKYKTELGEKGLRLSGGQKQRIAIARALLKKADILLLDEATSALDNENEKLFYDALEALHHKQTILLIAHRLSTAKKADRIIVMNEGKIEAIGKHEELLTNSETYKRLQSKPCDQ